MENSSIATPFPTTKILHKSLVVAEPRANHVEESSRSEPTLVSGSLTFVSSTRLSPQSARKNPFVASPRRGSPLRISRLEEDRKTRPRLRKYNTFDDAVKLVKRSSSIAVLVGAGISTSLGIPDFRSAGTGLYSQLANESDITDPQDYYHFSNFSEDKARFYSFAHRLKPPTSADGKPLFTPAHAFLRLLQDKGKLRTIYTQNVDGLEEAAGINPEKIVQVHGSATRGRCMRCGTLSNITEDTFRAVIDRGVVPFCNKCPQEVEIEDTRNGKRKYRGSKKSRKKGRRPWEDSDSDEDESSDAEPIIRPDMVFFGEGLPSAYWTRLDKDKPKIDLLIIIGTSMSVQPFCTLPADEFIRDIPQIFISRKHHSDGKIFPDIQLLGECDIVVQEMIRRAGWELEHEMVRPDSFPVKIEAMEGFEYKLFLKAAAKKPPKRQEIPIVHSEQSPKEVSKQVEPPPILTAEKGEPELDIGEKKKSDSPEKVVQEEILKCNQEEGPKSQENDNSDTTAIRPLEEVGLNPDIDID